MTPPRPDPRPAREPKAVEGWMAQLLGGIYPYSFAFTRHEAQPWFKKWGAGVDPKLIRVRITPVKRRPRAGGKTMQEAERRWVAKMQESRFGRPRAGGKRRRGPK